MPVALRTLIELTKDDPSLLNQILQEFRCEKDPDIEHFLHKRAVEFERLSKSRTYLICDEDQYADPDFSLDRLTIYGYLSLALKVLSVPEETSNRVRKELDGLSAKIHNEPIGDFPCYLIGQLSRNSCVLSSAISGAALIQTACDIIAAAVEAVGGRYIMIECHDDEKLVQFYSDNQFREIARVPDAGIPMVQMIRKIQ